MAFQRLTLFIISLVICANGFSQHSSPDTLKALRIEGSVTLDGKLNEDIWEKAYPISNFTQREQTEGAAPTEQTKVAVVYNTHEIIFGVWCYDSEPSKLLATQMSRDFDWGSDDDFEIMISPFNDNRNGYLFVTNPNGALADVWLGDEGHDFNFDWNGVWDARVTRDNNGWYAEIVIPFSTLKFKSGNEHVWGLNFERNVRRKKEQLLWQGWSRLYGVEKISQSGKLTGLKGIKQKEKLEIKPYILAGIERADGETNTTFKVGGEVNYDISPTMKVNLTLNTDFAQVESDRRQVNLSRFSLYYPEKRQFFLEGRSYFDMSIANASVFYSRKIGIEGNKAVPVLGGVRLFGKIDKTSIGFISLQTAADGEIPTANSTAFRIKQDIFKQSTVGFFTTQKFTGDTYNAVYGGDFTYSTSELFGNKNLITGVSGAFSVDRGGDPFTTSGRTATYHAFIYYPNDVWDFGAGINSVGENFRPGLGFSNRSNYKRIYGELEYNPRFKKMPSFVRNFAFRPFAFEYYINDRTGVSETFMAEIMPFGVELKSGDEFGVAVQHIMDKPFEDFELIDQVLIPAGTYGMTGFAAGFHTFDGRRISGGFEMGLSEFYTGRRNEYEMFLNLNLNRHLNIGIDWTKNDLSLPEGKFNVNEIGGRIEYAFNPKLNANVFAQWNTEEKEILLNYRINWIPKIGSFFYFVINQNISTEGDKLKLTRTTVIAKLVWRFAI